MPLGLKPLLLRWLREARILTTRYALVRQHRLGEAEIANMPVAYFPAERVCRGWQTPARRAKYMDVFCNPPPGQNDETY